MPQKLSRDQKRKQQLAERAKRAQGHVSSLAHPERYRTERYILAVKAAETGVLMADAVFHHQLLDREVEEGVLALVRELRAGSGGVEASAPELDGGEPGEVVSWLIRRHWEALFTRAPRHSDEELVGVLGVVLHSIDAWNRGGTGPRAYLDYLEEFLATLGVRVEEVLDPETPLRRAG
jgi:hypothetical protein